MKDVTKEVIMTDRLKLVPLSEQYAQDIFENLTDEIDLYESPVPKADR